MGNESSGSVKMPQRYFPGTVALCEISKYQKSTDLLRHKLSFARLVREMVEAEKPGLGWRIKSLAFDALQEPAEYHLVGFMKDVNLSAIHEKHVTTFPKDIQHVKVLHREVL